MHFMLFYHKVIEILVLKFTISSINVVCSSRGNFYNNNKRNIKTAIYGARTS
jgi:hypothetical protein